MKKSKSKKIAENSQINYDSNWKEMIHEFFPEFLEFVYNELFEIVDVEKGFTFLDKEFEKLIPTNERKGKIINDKLVRAQLKNGQEKYIYIHVEVQSSYDNEFMQRMFRYFYRIVDRYGLNITAIAIYADNHETFAPDTFVYKNLETELTYKFKTYKVLHQNDEELKKSNNPFALAVLAAYYKLKTGKTEYDSIKQYRFGLIRLLLERKFEREKILKILSFIYNILSLPHEKELEFNAEYIQKYKIKKPMPLTLNATSYNAFVEFFGEELEEKGRVAGRVEGRVEGREEGREEGKQEERQRSAFQTTIGCAKVNLPLETTIDLAGIDAETCILFLNKYKELGEDVYQWFENEYIKEFLAKKFKK